MFLLWCAWLIGDLISSQLQTIERPELPTVQVLPEKKVSTEGEPSYLFGKPDVEQTALATDRSVSPDELDQTRLKLKLIGVIVSQDKGVAIIEASGTTKVVSEGEEILSGVELLKVLPDQVVILHRGKQEKLMMERSEAALMQTLSAQSSPTAEASDLSYDQKQTLRNIGEELRQQPVSISKYIRFQPINEDGKWVAVKIWPRAEKEVFESIGFKAGDLLKSINGRSIHEMSQEPALWQAFLNDSRFELGVERKGQLVTLSVDLN
ncbi:type II secretion system protein GspC [Thiomicrorhabdus sp. zzn3]|uniref:type II secretion system protein GspC n=1 Tax=Thiomicrorhabdus sp. zzn3 TaxID=3039775 RepID=UPI002436BC8E|nr:type II secretion system protein GspC [Thiomicrorhabdus sp. zzn3]MDG6777315.1 type II secretion system protein GspC [Thiomicrorhabdus sp. zzn3]